MKLSRHELAKVLSKRLDDNQADAKQIAAYLLETGRARDLNSIARDIMSLRADAGIVELTLITARPVSSELKTSVKQLVKRLRPETKSVVIDEVVDKRLIGGFKLRLVHHELDAGLRGRLNNFKNNLDMEMV